MFARDVAVKATRNDGATRVRVLIRPKLQVLTNRAEQTGSALAQLREIVCTLNDNKVAILAVGQNFNDSGFFEVELRGGNPGDAVNISWVDAEGNKGQRGVVLK